AVAAERRTRPGGRRRRLGQNFLQSEVAERLVEAAAFAPGELVVEIGAGLGAFTRALARRRPDVVAFEGDGLRVEQLRRRLRWRGNVRLVHADFLAARLPARPFRVIGSLPFGRTTDILRHLLADPCAPLVRADVIVQWEVAQKRAAVPPTTLLGTAWAPW